jgi:endoglucanase
MWTHRLRGRLAGIALASLLVACIAVSVLVLVTRGWWKGIPLPAGITPAAIRVVSCTTDPNNLPASLPGPDGRPANYLHTCGSKIYDSHGREIRIAGLNWSGMEESGYSPGGLNSRNWQDVLDQIQALGYNTIRLPFSSEAMDSGRQIANANPDLNPDLDGLSWIDLLDHLISGARQRGLKVILDRHQPTSDGRTNLWYTPQVSEAQWIADWQTLARRYRGDDTVIGFDLSNEPHGEATWGSGDLATDWRLAAERAGNAVLAVNPNLLIFVEGVEYAGGDHFWWGGNLAAAGMAPVELSVPNRVVYSPHDYGPFISDQSWFHDPHYPNNLPSEWDRHWGYLQEEGIAPVVVGEFGGWSFGTDADGEWQRTLIAYLQAHQIGALVWSLNPSWDTGGILGQDWQTVDAAKQAAYQAILAPPIDPSEVPKSANVRPQPVVLARSLNADPSTGQVAFSFRILNNDRAPLDLSHLQARYWLATGPADLQSHDIQVDTGGLGGATVDVSVITSKRGAGDHYLRLQFGPGGNPIAGYRASGPISVRFQKPAGFSIPASSDYSFIAGSSPNDPYKQSPHLTLYYDGQLVWGKEP